MKEKQKGSELLNEEGQIKINYENIDVADIMSQIKRKIAKHPRKPQRYVSTSQFPIALEEGFGVKMRIKKMLLKILTPFSPLIKLFVLPVYEELRETIQILDQTNKRLDHIVEYTKLLHNLSHNMVVELSKLKIEEEDLKLKTRIMEKDFEFLGKRERALEKHLLR